MMEILNETWIISTYKYSMEKQDVVCLPKVLAVGVFKVTLLPQPSQDGPAFPLQPDQSAVLQNIPHQSPLVHHTLLHSLFDKHDSVFININNVAEFNVASFKLKNELNKLKYTVKVPAQCLSSGAPLTY